MSVIAKLSVRGVTPFGTGRLIELSCICENDLMAAYAGSEEDKLFTKYSPWGEMKISQPDGWVLAAEDRDDFTPAPVFYVMALHEKEVELVDTAYTGLMSDPNFAGSAAWAFGVCKSVTDFGNDSRRVEFVANNGGTVKGKAVEKLNWRMSVDNPLASNQFKPGERYYIVLYPAAKFDRNAAIAAAHAGPATA